MSGGVDSTMAALQLKRQGHNVVGVFMRNWDERDELGICNADADWIGMNFTKEYWMDVFSPFLSNVAMGETSNPDTQCNRMIKFGAFYNRCVREFGHDVKIGFALNPIKDQTYFLSQVQQNVLRHALFPVGHLFKTQVKEMARREGLDDIAAKPESMGICFVGKRRFGDFVGQYVEQPSGDFVDLDGNIMGRHRGLGAYTVGQRAAIAGRSEKLFVAAKRVDKNQIVVVPSLSHPALMCTAVEAEISGWNWIAGHEPRELSLPDATGSMTVGVMFRSRMQPVPAAISKDSSSGVYRVVFNNPQQGVPTGQDIAVYSGDVCLGGSRISRTTLQQEVA
eukprot:jgi/Hompol1/5197/HPOL_004225-RA